MNDFRYRLRPAAMDDFDAVARLDYQQIRFHADLAPHILYPVPEHLYAERWRPYGEKLLSSPENLVLLAESNRDAVGYLVAKLEPAPPIVIGSPRLLVEDIYVQAEHRGKGVGTALLEKSFQWGKEHGATRVALQVTVANQAARAFYAGKGFEATDLMMRRPL